MAIESEATELLRRMIRHRTVNPPGNERPLQEMLAAQLAAVGVESRLVGSSESRPNLVARVEGREPGPVLALLSHVDTVPADGDRWRHDPWSGALDDGDIWGRGAQDMKSQTAAEAAALIDLVRSGWRPARGDLLLISVVDEERGGGEGAIWLCEQHPELVRCDYLLNEGAGTAIPWGDGRVYGVCTAEKGVFRFTITVNGRPGHASMPQLADNPLPRLAKVVEALASARPAHDMTEAPERLLAALELASVDELRAADPALAGFVEPMVSVTFAPTMISASETINIIPASATLHVDCRTPPGHGLETAEARLREALEGCGVVHDLRFDVQMVGNSSPADSPLMDAIGRWISAEDPGARVVPFMLPAYTDSRAFRDAFPECVAYGFFPQRERTIHEAWPLVHGIDERIAAADVGWAARCYRALALDLLG